MDIWRLLYKEILHRKFSFVLGALSAAIAVGVLMGELTLLRSDDVHQEQILATHDAKAVEHAGDTRDRFRKRSLEESFDLFIAIPDEKLGFAESMPEEYVERLAKAPTVIVQHLLPLLEQKIFWDDDRYKGMIYVDGAKDEIRIAIAPKNSTFKRMEPGTAVLGFKLWQALGREEEEVTLKGRTLDGNPLEEKTLKIVGRYPERFNKDDQTLWMNLDEAQDLFKKPGTISGILAFDCTDPACPVGQRQDLAGIRDKIQEILPDVQVYEIGVKMQTRVGMRSEAEEIAQGTVLLEKEEQGDLRRQREAFAAWFVPLVIVGATAWIMLLAFINVRERSGEIGILRAIGVQSRQIMILFLSRAILLGVIGAVVGGIAGIAVGMIAGRASFDMQVIEPLMAVLVLVAAPVLSALASWAPAAAAARQDPADVLREK